ncbi:MAG TPA: class I SAM-dependent methyltransferase [Nocardioides sp.]|nr:class I SAM-dependent methyltransferase [Nocardioides sp.]
MTSREDIETWDREAETFDEAADHGLSDPECRAAWRDLLLEALPPAPARVADLGCGTGTLSLLLAEEGYAVTGVDFSSGMVRRAREKAGHLAVFHEGDAAAPPLAEAAFDVVLCRHVLWALPAPGDALARWVRLLTPGGRLVLVEGRWHTGGGLPAARTLDLLRAAGREPRLRPMPEPVFWGREIEDERYLVVA